jgi:hypothetical protein
VTTLKHDSIHAGQVHAEPDLAATELGVSPRVFAAVSAPPAGNRRQRRQGRLGQSGASGGDVIDLRAQPAQPVEQASGEPNHDSVIKPRGGLGSWGGWRFARVVLAALDSLSRRGLQCGGGGSL